MLDSVRDRVHHWNRAFRGHALRTRRACVCVYLCRLAALRHTQSLFCNPGCPSQSDCPHIVPIQWEVATIILFNYKPHFGNRSKCIHVDVACDATRMVWRRTWLWIEISGDGGDRQWRTNMSASFIVSGYCNSINYKRIDHRVAVPQNRIDQKVTTYQQ